MDRFADASDVYRRVGRLIEDLIADPLVAERFATVDGVVQYRLREPESTITIDLRAGREPNVHYGDSELEPQIILDTDAAVAWRLWSGELDTTIAIARDELSASGPTEKLLVALGTTEIAAGTR
jgi:hypothetical protein